LEIKIFIDLVWFELTAVTNEYQIALLVLLSSTFALADIRIVGILYFLLSSLVFIEEKKCPNATKPIE
jgi:hypothetical protein